MAYRLSPKARVDLDDIWYGTASARSVDKAEWLSERLTGNFHMLAAFPKAGRTRDDLGKGRRGFPIDDYLIVYRIDGGDVHILRVVDGRRDLPALLGSE